MENLAQVDIGGKFNSPFGKTGGQGLGNFVSIVLSNAVSIAGVILLVVLIVGGIAMIKGAGNNNPEAAAKARMAATTAAIGFVVVFASYWILQLIEAVTGLQILNQT